MGEIRIEPGSPSPLGASEHKHGVNFALVSKHATSITLCLFSPGAHRPFFEIALNPNTHRTGFVWHVRLQGLPSLELEYGYRIAGPKDPPHMFHPELVLSDPYAKALATPHTWGDWEALNHMPPRAKLLFPPFFDWEGTFSPRIPMEDLIIYEAHVRGFTLHLSSGVQNKGTFRGLIEKIPYLKELGINAIELLPIFEFNECENAHVNPKTEERLKNYWGYSTINFFSATPRYASTETWNGTVMEFRELVRELHKHGIELILDVVYNHTAEGGKTGPVYTFKGIDNDLYYLLKENGEYLNFSGTGNTMNANDPTVVELILDSLRYWVTEMHVDGFRFDLASCLTRDENGEPLADPPVIKRIAEDPVLKNVKLIAEAWDAGGLYQVGNFPAYERWAEWNGRYRDVVRRFLKGTDGYAGPFATALCGSQDLYAPDRTPAHSINFITAHDGFTLKDLVSYQEKHNVENGEENRDGLNENDSWNCGVEGITKKHKVIALRERQVRNFLTSLFLSLGTPMILMGDEYGHTRYGNNNAYSQDNALNWFLWDELKRNASLYQFCRQLIAFRKKAPLLRRTTFLTTDDVDWHGTMPFSPSWEEPSRFVAYTLKDHNPLYVAFNASFELKHVTLPPPPPGKHWYCIIDTSADAPRDFVEHPLECEFLKERVSMKEYSAFVAQAY
jgi:isoamylase